MTFKNNYDKYKILLMAQLYIIKWFYKKNYNNSMSKLNPINIYKSWMATDGSLWEQWEPNSV